MSARSGISLSNCRLVRPLVAFVVLIFVFPPAALVFARPPSAEKIAAFKNAVVIVTTYDDHEQPLLQGSGFFISPARVVTNLHVIERATTIRIQTFAGKAFTVQTIIATDEGADLALLQMDASCVNATPLQIADKSPTEGEPIILVSNPQGSGWQVSPGAVGRIWQFINFGKRLQITAGVFPGSSGGPVLNQQGQVVGIAVMSMTSSDNLNFAVPVENLKSLQASAPVPR